MSTPSENWTADEVAKWLGYSTADAFLRKREELYAGCGFPRPLPGIGRLLWSAVSLSAWQASLLDQASRKALAELTGVKLRTKGEGAALSGDWNDILISRLDREVA